MSSMRESTDLAALHRLWAEVHAAAPDDAAGLPSGTGLRGKVVRQIGSVAADVSEPSLRADRALIGALIRTNDALAIRCDELGARVVELEDLLREVVSVVGDDVVQLRGPRPAGTTPTPSPTASPVAALSPSPRLMADLLADGSVLLLSSTWDDVDFDQSFVMRSLAGAISRRRPVDVATPGPPRSPRADGLFDVHQIGTGSPDDPA